MKNCAAGALLCRAPSAYCGGYLRRPMCCACVSATASLQLAYRCGIVGVTAAYLHVIHVCLKITYALNNMNATLIAAVLK